MFITSVEGLFVSISVILLSTVVAYKFKPAKIGTRFDKVTLAVFFLAVFSSIWGTTAPTIGSAVTVFRVAIIVFWALYCWKLVRNREDPFKGLSPYHWVLAAMMALMLMSGLITLLFFTPSHGYTLSRLTNIFFDFLLCAAVFFYVRTQGVIRALMTGLTVTMFGQMAAGVFECYAGPLYATTHLATIGPNFLGLLNLHLPSVSFMNTNDYTASLFFMGMLVIVYWLYRLIVGGNAKLSIAIIVTTLCGQWFVSYCGGSVLVQIGVVVFAVVLFVVAGIWAAKNKRLVLLVVFLIPILFAMMLQVSPSIDVSQNDVQQIQNEPLEGFSGLGTGTSETMERTTRYRMALLEFSLETFVEHPLGAGMGNTQKFAESDAQLMKELGNRSKLHCYLAECAADYGLPFIVIGLVAVFLVLKRAYLALRSNDPVIGTSCNKTIIVLLLATLPCAVFISTAPSSAQDLKAMWIYLGLLMVMFESCTRGDGLAFDKAESPRDSSLASRVSR